MKLQALIFFQLVLYLAVTADLLDNLGHAHDHHDHHHHHDDQHDHHDELIADYDDIPPELFQFLPQEGTSARQTNIRRPLLAAQLQKELDALNFLEGVEFQHFDPDSNENVAVLNQNSVSNFEPETLPLLGDESVELVENIPEEFDQFRSLLVPSEPFRFPDATLDNNIRANAFIPLGEFTDRKVLPEIVTNFVVPSEQFRLPDTTLNNNVKDTDFIQHNQITENNALVKTDVVVPSKPLRQPDTTLDTSIPETGFISRDQFTESKVLAELKTDVVVPSKPLRQQDTTFDNSIPKTGFILREQLTESKVLTEIEDDIVEEIFDDLGLSEQSNFEEVSNFIGGTGRQLDSGIDSDEDDESSDEYPRYARVPSTSFRCEDHEYGGYYADTEAECQVFHICHAGSMMGSFLCPNQTLFNQELFVCDWWYNVRCDSSPNYFDLNARIGVVIDDSNSLED